MTRPFLASGLCAAALSLVCAGTFAADAPPAKAKAKAATPHEQLKSEAKGLALAGETMEAISASQLAIADRVMTGHAQCEFNQQVSVEALSGKPGFFKVGFKNVSYTMVPEETSTGAVRLYDKNAGVVWLQIPSKSMLMNNKLGQRMVDSCTQAAQRGQVEAASANLIQSPK